MAEQDNRRGGAGAALVGLIAAIGAAVLFFVTAQEKQLATLVVRADPAGAQVRLVEPRMPGEYPTDQRATSGEVEFPNLEGRARVRLTVSAKGYQQEVVEATLPPSGTQTLAVKLKPESGLYTVRTEPEGALLYLDGKPAGIAPAVLSDVGAGRHELHAHLEGYEKKVHEFVAEAGAHKQLRLTLVPLPAAEDAGPAAESDIPDGRGRLRVTSTHSARFFLNNYVIGYGMSTDRAVAPGRYRVTARAEGRDTKWKVASVEEGETVEVAFEFNDDPVEKAMDATDPSKPIYWTIRGGITRNEGKYGDAVDKFKKALELDETDVVAHRQLSRTYPALKMWDEAIEHAEKYLELSPGAPDEKFTRELIEQYKQKRDNPEP